MNVAKRLFAVILVCLVILATGPVMPTSAKSSAPGPNGEWNVPVAFTELGPGFLAAPGKASKGYGSDNGYPRTGFRHSGLDLLAPEGSPVYPIAPGTVIEAWEHDAYGKDDTYGGAVLIEHKNENGETFYAVYGHININKDIRGQGDYDKPNGKCVAEDTCLGWILDYDGEFTKGNHLHLGISKTQQSNPWAGRFPLNGSVPKGWVDPVEYLNKKMGTAVSRYETVTCSFDANGGWFAPKDIRARQGGFFAIPKAKAYSPVRVGWRLLGWARSADAVKPDYSNEGASLKAKESITLYAVWESVFERLKADAEEAIQDHALETAEEFQKKAQFSISEFFRKLGEKIKELADSF